MGDRRLRPGGENTVKISVALFCLVVVSLSAAADVGEPLHFLDGEWSGPGKLSGTETTVTQSWQSALNGTFTNLQHTIWIEAENGRVMAFQGTGYYHQLPDKTLSGVWIGSDGNIHPLLAQVDENTLTVLWGNGQSESGKSVYRLLEDGSLRVVDSVENPDGSLREFASASLVREKPNEEGSTVARVTGIGGVFMLANNNAKELSDWYLTNLGMQREDFGGVVLQWQEDLANDNGLTVWHIAEKDSKWFSPSESRFMINYRVDNLDEMISQLKANGVEIFGGPESHENGKFAWIMDPEGNKVELWEPMLWDDANKAADP